MSGDQKHGSKLTTSQAKAGMSLTSFKLLVLLSIAAHLSGITRGLARSADTAALTRDEPEVSLWRRELLRPADDVTTESLKMMDPTTELAVRKKRYLHSLQSACVTLPWRLLPRTCFHRVGRVPGRRTKIPNGASVIDIRAS
ncbi:hypothetical protein Bbelb_368040, partial [Branchiostoma belcheri]